MNSIEQVLRITWHWLSVVSLLIFCICFTIRWIQTHKISNGHSLIGATANLVCLFQLLILMFAPGYGWFFSPFSVLLTGVWVGYNDWYFHNYPTLAAWMSSPDRKPDTVGMDTMLAKFLIERDPAPGTFWEGSTARLAGMGLVALLLLAFGFSERLNGLAESDRRLAEITVRTERKATLKIERVKEEIKESVSQVTDSVVRNRQVLRDEIAATHAQDQRERAQIKNDLALANSNLDKKLNRVSAGVERVRRSPVVPVTPLQPRMTDFPIQRQVQPIPTAPTKKKSAGRQGKYGFLDVEQTDSTYYARGKQEDN